MFNSRLPCCGQGAFMPCKALEHWSQSLRWMIRSWDYSCQHCEIWKRKEHSVEIVRILLGTELTTWITTQDGIINRLLIFVTHSAQIESSGKAHRTCVCSCIGNYIVNYWSRREFHCRVHLMHCNEICCLIWWSPCNSPVSGQFLVALYIHFPALEFHKY